MEGQNNVKITQKGEGCFLELTDVVVPDLVG